MLRLAQQHDIPMEGACEGVCACSTCHVVLADDAYDMVEDLVPLTDEEEDMLDEAIGVEDNSRLSCQILMEEKFDGLKVTLAPGTEL